MMNTYKTLLLSLLLLPVVNTEAAIYVVETALDLPDDDLLDGVCDTGLSANNPTCSLRAAVMESNASMGVFDTIVLPNNMGEFDITRVDEDDDAFKGDLDITDDVSIINGTTAGATIDGRFNDRVFHVHPGVTLNLEGINIVNGLANTQNSFRGGAVLVEGGTLLAERVRFINNMANIGGAIQVNSGTLDLSETYFHHNAASDAGFTGTPRGSAIHAHDAQLDISLTTLADNVHLLSNPQLVPVTTTIAAVSTTDSDVRVNNSTIVNGHQGISFTGNNDLDMEHVTVAHNSDIGVRVLSADNLLVDRSLMVGNATGCLLGPVQGSSTLERSGSTDSSCQLVSPTNFEDMDNPVHGSVNDWGGFAPTLMLYAGSGAVDAAGVCDPGLLLDQRGEARPMDGNDDSLAFCDMGAVEYNPDQDNDVIFRDDLD